MYHGGGKMAKKTIDNNYYPLLQNKDTFHFNFNSLNFILQFYATIHTYLICQSVYPV